MKIFLALMSLFMVTQSWASPIRSPSNTPLQKIAFGSCNNLELDKRQKFWSRILAEKPDLWLWMGDIIYADEKKEYKKALSKFSKLSTEEQKKSVLALEEIRAKAYAELFNNKYYKLFREQVHIDGTWDDHDFAHNDATGSYVGKQQSQNSILNFLEYPEGHDLYKQSGIYHDYEIGPKDKSVHIVMLDLRANSQKNQLLGAEQWSWLESRIKQSRAKVLILVSSIYFSRDLALKDTWSDYPEDLKKLKNLIAAREKPVVILSGDLHYGAYAISQIGKAKVYELTSSGMTHVRNVAKQALRESLTPDAGVQLSDNILKKNYGVLEFDWDEPEPKLFFKLMSITNNEVFLKLQLK